MDYFLIVNCNRGNNIGDNGANKLAYMMDKLNILNIFALRLE